MVNKQKNNLFWYMLFLRLTPLIPNWFVNVGSPLVGIPYLYFLVGTCIGSFISTQDCCLTTLFCCRREWLYRRSRASDLAPSPF